MGTCEAPTRLDKNASEAEVNEFPAPLIDTIDTQHARNDSTLYDLTVDGIPVFFGDLRAEWF